jgi:FtsZ-interacting cell division protein ZipA
LAWWERRKRGQAPRASDEQTLAEPSSRVVREPLLTLPDIRVREPAVPEELPVVQIADYDESLMGLRIDGAPPLGELPVAREAPEEPEVEPPAPAEAAGFELPKLPQAEEPIVEWPPEQERRILALRIVCMGPDRFPGRAVRTALVAEGFMLGKYSIFHKPDGERRSVLSAASLSKPGVFDPDTIDSQRFGGLSLFAVLPGPLPPREAFEDLLVTARNLNERLQGGLQDERGSPLTPTRIAALRDGLGAIAASGAATIQ